MNSKFIVSGQPGFPGSPGLPGNYTWLNMLYKRRTHIYQLILHVCKL